jgi:CheY-like chemotaxis protein
MLAGKRVLVVEDEPVVAMCLEDVLEDLGLVLVGTAHDVASGMVLVEQPADVAVLDINLGEETSAPIAVALAARAVPIVFATGYDRDAAPAHAEVIAKPYSSAQVEAALTRVLAAAAAAG